MLRSRPAVLRFAAFELDLANAVLRKDGQVVKLAPQPFKALAYFALRPQRLVTREELRHALWSTDTTVDFEHGLNTCIRQVRTALGDEAAAILETVPKMGYRFRAPILRDTRAAVLRWTAVAACVLVAAAAAERWRSKGTAVGANPEAEALYVRGKIALEQNWGPRDTTALDLFQRAASIDPQYAPAYAGISEAFRLKGFTGTMSPRDAYPRALAAARHALSLAPSSSDAHLAMGDVKTWFERDWAGAEREYRTAIEGDPQNAAAREQLALWLSLRGRFSEALAESTRAQALDPLGPRAAYAHAHVLHYARRFDECLAAARKALDLDPGYFPAYHTLGQCHEGRREFDLAIEFYQRSGRKSGNLGHAYAAAGRTEEAREVLAELLRRHGSAGAGMAAPEIAQTYAGLGEADHAFEWLERAYAEGCWLGTLKVAPVFDGLRGDPRFARLLQRAGLAD